MRGERGSRAIEPAGEVQTVRGSRERPSQPGGAERDGRNEPGALVVDGAVRAGRQGVDGMTPNPPGAKPAYSIRVPGPAAAAVTTVVSDAPGTITVHADESDPAGDRRITLDADGGPTLRWLVRALRQRLGADLLLAEDLAFAAASTGKFVQRACAATTTSHGLALSDADADRHVIDLEVRAAAVHALVATTPSGGLLPPLDHPRLIPAAAAAAHVLAAGC